VERDTVAIYEARGRQWAARRAPVRHDGAVAFAARVAEGAGRLDAGSGAGRYTAALGAPVVALDAARTMLGLLREAAPAAWPVQGDLEALPLRTGGIAGAWANMSYLHVPRVRLPMALADLHRAMGVGAPLDVQVLAGDYEGTDLPSDDVGGRFFSSWEPDALVDVLVGAGFDVEHVEVEGDAVRARGTRTRTLADTVGAGMTLLVCGLNPSVYAADRGVGYARPTNRFWPAAVEAGLVTRPRDAVHALRACGVGLTDLVKRATPAASALTAAEYRAGAARVERLVRWLRPGAVCFVGLDGWRAAVDRRAVAGVQPAPFATRPAYVMPSTSGLNAHASRADLVAHLGAALRLGREAAAGAAVSPPSPGGS
jgi:double-stranded uracil-DNA glycosylase